LSLSSQTEIRLWLFKTPFLAPPLARLRLQAQDGAFPPQSLVGVLSRTYDPQPSPSFFPFASTLSVLRNLDALEDPLFLPIDGGLGVYHLKLHGTVFPTPSRLFSFFSIPPHPIGETARLAIPIPDRDSSVPADKAPRQDFLLPHFSSPFPSSATERCFLCVFSARCAMFVFQKSLQSSFLFTTRFPPSHSPYRSVSRSDEDFSPPLLFLEREPLITPILNIARNRTTSPENPLPLFLDLRILGSLFGSSALGVATFLWFVLMA